MGAAGGSTLDHGLDLFFGAFAEHQAPADAAHRDHQGVAVPGEELGGLPSGIAGAADQLVGVGPHQAGDAARRDVSGEGQRTVFFANAEDGPHQRFVAAVLAPHREREQQGRPGQALRTLAQVGLVQVERRLAVELVQHIAAGAGDAPLRSEVRPSGVATVAHPQAVAVQTDGADAVLLGHPVVEHPGAAEAVTVACQTPCDHDPFRQAAGQASHQGCAIHAQAIREHEDRAQAFSGQLVCQAAAGRLGVGGARDRRAGIAQAGVLECGDGHADAAVQHLLACDLTRGRAPEQHRAGKGRRQGGQCCGCVGEFRRAKCQHQRLRSVEVARQRLAPALGRGVLKGVVLHVLDCRRPAHGCVGVIRRVDVAIISTCRPELITT